MDENDDIVPIDWEAVCRNLGGTGRMKDGPHPVPSKACERWLSRYDEDARQALVHREKAVLCESGRRNDSLRFSMKNQGTQTESTLLELAMNDPDVVRCIRVVCEDGVKYALKETQNLSSTFRTAIQAFDELFVAGIGEEDTDCAE